MPRACPVVPHARLYYLGGGQRGGCHGLSRGGHAPCPPAETEPPETRVSLHGTSPWHPTQLETLFLETRVSLHGTSPWHPKSTVPGESPQSWSGWRSFSWASWFS